jgi:hypothetical protein
LSAPGRSITARIREAGTLSSPSPGEYIVRIF